MSNSFGAVSSVPVSRKQPWQPGDTVQKQNVQKDSDHAQTPSANQRLLVRISNWFPVSTSSMGCIILAWSLWAL